jgi:hypothetical protein
MIRIFFQDAIEAVALRQIGILITMLAPPIDGTDTDGALIQAPAAPAPRAFTMGEKPLQAPAKFRQGKTLVSPEAMGQAVSLNWSKKLFTLATAARNSGWSS